MQIGGMNCHDIDNEKDIQKVTVKRYDYEPFCFCGCYGKSNQLNLNVD